MIVFSALGAQKRVGYFTGFTQTRQSENGVYSYSLRILYYDKIFRNSDLYNVYLVYDSVPTYFSDIRFKSDGSPFGQLKSTQAFNSEDRVDIEYTLRVATGVIMYWLLFMIIMPAIFFRKKISAFFDSLKIADNTKVSLAVSLILITLAELFFLRELFSIPTIDSVIGSLGDGVLTPLLTEHWYKALTSNNSFVDLIAFYPVKNTIAYSDMLLVYAAPYSLLRLFGLDIFLSYKIVLILTHVFGSFSMFYLLKKTFKLGYMPSLIGVVIFSYSISQYTTRNHTQLLALSYVPLLIIFLFNFLKRINFDKHFQKTRIKYGVASIIVLALLFYNSYYIAYFTMVFCLILLSVSLFYLNSHKINFFAVSKTFVKEYKKEIIFYICFGIFVMLPFVLLYLPAAVVIGARGWGNLVSQLPVFSDFFNMNKYSNYGDYGFSFIVILSVALSFLHFKKYSLETLKTNNTFSALREYNISIYLLTVSIIISCLMLVKVNNLSLWIFILHFLPGASAAIAAKRYLYFLILPIAIVVAFYINNCQLKSNSNNKYILFTIIFLILVFSENIFTTRHKFDRIAQSLEYLEHAVVAPPSDAEIMYVISDKTDPEAQLEAWFVANKYNLKTINGYSGSVPKDWNLHNNVDIDLYIAEVDKWIEMHELTNVYSYNVAENKWEKHRSR